MNAYFKGNVETRLKAIGMTQKTLAEKIGVTEVTMSRWLSGSTGMTVDNLEKIAKVLGTTSSFLLSDGQEHHIVVDNLEEGDEEQYANSEGHTELKVTYKLILGLLLAAVSLGLLTDVQKQNLITVLEFKREDIDEASAKPSKEKKTQGGK